MFDGHHVQRSKLIVDTIKWEVSKLLPKLYGDKITQELDITGDLAQLLEAASNRDNGLPPPIDVEFKKVESTKNLESCLLNENTHSIEGEVPTHDDNHPVSVGSVSEINYLRGFKSSPSTPSNQRRNRRRCRKLETDE